MFKIRNEIETDYKIVEDVTRKAFYNVYSPGCMEHYLVHIMRGHEDFVPELDFVRELDGQVIGNIMYTKAKLTDEKRNGKGNPYIRAGQHTAGVPEKWIRKMLIEPFRSESIGTRI